MRLSVVSLRWRAAAAVLAGAAVLTPAAALASSAAPAARGCPGGNGGNDGGHARLCHVRAGDLAD